MLLTVLASRHKLLRLRGVWCRWLSYVAQNERKFLAQQSAASEPARGASPWTPTTSYLARTTHASPRAKWTRCSSITAPESSAKPPNCASRMREQKRAEGLAAQRPYPNRRSHRGSQAIELASRAGPRRRVFWWRPGAQSDSTGFGRAQCGRNRKRLPAWPSESARP
jgi:hypothetical protein